MENIKQTKQNTNPTTSRDPSLRQNAKECNQGGKADCLQRNVN